MGSRRSSFLAALVLLAPLGAQGRAEMVDFGYSWGFGPVAVSSSGVGSVSHSISGNILTLTHNTGTVALTLPASGGGSALLDGSGGFSVPTGTFTATSNGSIPPGNQFFSAVVNQVLKVTDQSSGLTGNLNLQTTITGASLGAGGGFVLASSLGTGYSPGLTLGEHRFGLDGVGFGMVTPEGPLTFTMAAKVANESSFQQTPEPSSLLLGLGAASLCGLAARRRRR